MNKTKLHITTADLKRCDRAIAAVRHMAQLKQCKRFYTAGLAAGVLVDRLERLKSVYTSLAGSVLTKESKLMPRPILRGMIGMVNQMYGFAYPAPRAAEWRSEILKPLTLTIERIDWQEAQP